jgi:hypothetical protein
MNLKRFFGRESWAVAIVCLVATLSYGGEKETVRYYHVDATLMSLDAGHTLASYRVHGNGTGTPGATLSYGFPGSQVDIALSVENGHFFADITVRNVNKSDAGKKQRVDLTNLRPATVDLGADKDGRTYQLNLVPSVKSLERAPKPFREIADDLYRLRFHSSRIMLNDNQYVGRMLASDAEIFSIEICGVAGLQFSLHHLRDSQPWGRLENGSIAISNPNGTTVEIQNVTNGSENRVIEGGPCMVWVRWNKPRQTVNEFRAMLEARRDELKQESAAAGPGSTVAGALTTIEKELAREPGPWVTECGACGVTKREVVDGD